MTNCSLGGFVMYCDSHNFSCRIKPGLKYAHASPYLRWKNLGSVRDVSHHALVLGMQ